MCVDVNRKKNTFSFFHSFTLSGHFLFCGIQFATNPIYICRFRILGYSQQMKAPILKLVNNIVCRILLFCFFFLSSSGDLNSTPLSTNNDVIIKRHQVNQTKTKKKEDFYQWIVIENEIILKNNQIIWQAKLFIHGHYKEFFLVRTNQWH